MYSSTLDLVLLSVEWSALAAQEVSTIVLVVVCSDGFFSQRRTIWNSQGRMVLELGENFVRLIRNQD